MLMYGKRWSKHDLSKAFGVDLRALFSDDLDIHVSASNGEDISSSLALHDGYRRKRRRRPPGRIIPSKGFTALSGRVKTYRRSRWDVEADKAAVGDEGGKTLQKPV